MYQTHTTVDAMLHHNLLSGESGTFPSDPLQYNTRVYSAMSRKLTTDGKLLSPCQKINKVTHSSLKDLNLFK